MSRQELAAELAKLSIEAHALVMLAARSTFDGQNTPATNARIQEARRTVLATVAA